VILVWVSGHFAYWTFRLQFGHFAYDTYFFVSPYVKGVIDLTVLRMLIVVILLLLLIDFYPRMIVVDWMEFEEVIFLKDDGQLGTRSTRHSSRNFTQRVTS